MFKMLYELNVFSTYLSKSLIYIGNSAEVALVSRVVICGREEVQGSHFVGV